MFKYFSELEDRNNMCLNLIDDKHVVKEIDINQIPLDKYIECLNIIKELGKLNPLKLKSNEKNMIFTNYSSLDGASSIIDGSGFEEAEDEEEKSLSYYRFDNNLFNNFIYGISLDSEGITKNGSKKMCELIDDYLLKFDDDRINQYLSIIEDNFNECILINDKYDIIRIINDKAKLLRFQGRLCNDLDNRIKELNDYIYNYNIKISDWDYNLYDMELYDSWFITPYNYLFNTMGYYKGHQVSNLLDYYYNLLQSIDFMDEEDLYKKYKSCLESIKLRLDNNYFRKIDFHSTFNLRWDCYSLHLNDYYLMNKEDRLREDLLYAKCYDKKIINLFNGLDSALASMYEFFYELRKYSNDFERDINVIRGMDFVDFLVRCCKFNKIESSVDKTISTSCINYEEEFIEYINRGWNIEFICPFIINNGILMEYPNEFIKIRKILKEY